MSHRGTMHVILNMSDTARPVAMPAFAGYAWRRTHDTALASPLDISPPEEQAVAEGDLYVAQARGVVVLETHV